MVDDAGSDTAGNHRSDDSPHEIKPAGNSIEGVDNLISDLPDEILEHVLSFIPTKFAIRSSLLSRRWRHVWSKTRSLYFDSIKTILISKTLNYHKAPKITSLYISTVSIANDRKIDYWIEFAVFHKAEKLSFTLAYDGDRYRIPESFYVNSSLKQLELKMRYFEMLPRGSVFWNSLTKLSLKGCIFSNESFPKILSGSPVLESLELELCKSVKVFDLSKSPHLRRLVIYACDWYQGPLKIVIVAPHLQSLTLRNFRFPCSLVDVSSLTEANLDNVYHLSKPLGGLTTDFIQDMLNVLEKLHNVKKLTIGEGFLQILSLAELCDVPFPTFKIKSLTLLISVVSQSIVPGIKRLLQNSHGLKKLTLHPNKYRNSISEKDFDRYLNTQGLNPDQCKDLTFPTFLGQNANPKLVSSSLKLVLKYTKTLETIILCVEDDIDETRFEELLQVASTLSHSNNVSIWILKSISFYAS